MSNPARTIRRDTRVFISAVTRELGSVRKLVKKGLEDNDYHAVEQDNFPPDYRDLKAKLRERINSCDAVVHIAGLCYGAEPAKRPDDAPRRSYTQLEYDIAAELGKPVYVFLTGADFPADPHEPEAPELQKFQAAHRERLMATGQDYNPASSIQELDQKIRSLQLKVQRLTDEIHQVDQKMDVHGGRLRRWLAGVAVLVVAGLGVLAYLGWQQQVELQAWQREQVRQQAERERQQAERDKQERERLAAEAARKEAQTIQQVQQEFAERFLQQLLTNKEIKAEEARQRALKELPALVKLPLAEIQSLIDRKIAPRATEKNLSPLDRARAALAKGNYDEVFHAADDQKQEGRELAMLEGTAALARFRQSPKPEWNARALAAFQRAMALANPDSPTEWQAWTDAAVAAASVLRELARYAEAEPLLRQCQRLREANSGSDSPGVAVVLNNLALLLQATNRLSEAEPLFRRALAIGEKSYGPDHPTVAIDLSSLAMLLKATNRLSEAEPLYRRALAIDEKSYGPDHPNVAIDLNNLAVLLRATNRLSEAEPLFRRALAIGEKSYGPDHPTVASTLSNLAMLLKATNRLSEADPLYRRALAIDEKSYGPDHPNVAIRLNGLAGLLLATNRLSEAEPLYRRALAIDEKSYGPDHPKVAFRLNNLGLLLQATNRLSKAEPLMARSVRIFFRFQRSTGHEHRYMRAALEYYRRLLTELKLAESEIAARIEAAREGTEKLSPIVPEVERLLGRARPVADVLTSLDRKNKEQGRPAVYFLKPGEPIAPLLDELLRPNGEGLNAEGVLAFRRGSHADAVVLYEAALELMANQPAQAPAKLRARMNRAAALRELGMIAQARDELARLLPELDQVSALDSTTKVRARYHLGLSQWRLGDRAAAQRSAEESLADYDAAPKSKPVDPAIRRQSEELLAAVKVGKAPPPLAKIDAHSALEAARARYRAREALTKLPLTQQAAPLLDQVLGPARPTQEVFDALDRDYREQRKPAVWFLPLDQPIAPHLDELLGKPSR
jgi:tetratricopeptide (TPR) repeat protein